MALNDTSMHPTGVQVGYPGVANPSTASTDQPSDVYGSAGILTGHVPAADANSDDPIAAEAGKQEVVGKSEIIESAELAPLGEDKIVSDSSSGSAGIVEQATTLAKDAYNAVVGEK